MRPPVGEATDLSIQRTEYQDKITGFQDKIAGFGTWKGDQEALDEIGKDFDERSSGSFKRKMPERAGNARRKRMQAARNPIDIARKGSKPKQANPRDAMETGWASAEKEKTRKGKLRL